jgi:hypothetical protein
MTHGRAWYFQRGTGVFVENEVFQVDQGFSSSRSRASSASLVKPC